MAAFFPKIVEPKPKPTPSKSHKGNNFVGRYGESINTNLGIKNLIVEKGYELIAKKEYADAEATFKKALKDLKMINNFKIEDLNIKIKNRLF